MRLNVWKKNEYLEYFWSTSFSMRIATWNINSVRLRIHHVLRFIKEQNIDVMCLQETKTEDDYFPISQFIDAGMKYCNFRGEKSYNGVAILSKIPIKENYLLTGELEKTNEPYAVSKIAGVKMCESYNFQYKTNYKCLILM